MRGELFLPLSQNGTSFQPSMILLLGTHWHVTLISNHLIKLFTVEFDLVALLTPLAKLAHVYIYTS